MSQTLESKTVPLDVRLEKAKRGFLSMLGPWIEIGYGVYTKTLPYPVCVLPGLIACLAVPLHLDYWLFNKMKVSYLYPTKWWLYWVYLGFLLTSGFLVWGAAQANRMRRITRRLKEVFINKGLRTSMGRLPGFISDRPLDSQSRILKLSLNGVPRASFEAKREEVAGELGVYIDQMKENRERRSLEIYYSLQKMPEQVDLSTPYNLLANQYIIGDTRRQRLVAKLQDVPHLLVAGYTNSGKSTFLRQFIVTLYLNNKAMEFVLMDLKDGLEFQYLEDLPRIHVCEHPKEALELLRSVEEEIHSRAEFLKQNQCKNLDDYGKVRVEDRKFTSIFKAGTKISRKLVVLDEAAELFLTGGRLESKEVQQARRLTNTIVAQGRAVGLHMVLATQRPDRNAIDPITKANLQGRLCFSMADNASSMTILDSVRAADLPPIRGRAIWRSGLDLVEVQVPQLTEEKAKEFLSPFRPKETKPTPKSSSQTLDSKVNEQERDQSMQAAIESVKRRMVPS